MAFLVSPSPIQQATTAAGPSSRAALRSQIVEHLAEVRAVSSQDIYVQMKQNGGDLAMTDKEAKWVCVSLEEDFQCDGKFSIGDLCKPLPPGSTPQSNDKPGGGCVDPAEDTTVSRLLGMATQKFGL